MSNSALSGDTVVIAVPHGTPAVTRRRKFRGVAAMLGVGFLAIWSLASVTELLNPRFYPTPWAIVEAIPRQLSSEVFWSSLSATLSTWLVAVFLVVVLGITVGILIGSSTLLYQLSRLVIEFLRPIPSVAILPLILLLLGPTDQTKIILAVYAGFWPMLIQTMYGIRSTDPVLLDTAKSFGLNRFQIARHVVLPSSLPYLATGLRISSALALVLTVTVEIIIGVQGLGREIFVNQSAAAVPDMYVLIVVTGLLGLGINELFRLVEKKALSWHQSQRAERK